LIRALAKHVVHINAGRLTHYPGGYQYYLDKTKAQSERAGLTAGGKERGNQAQAAAEMAGEAGNGSAVLSRKDQKRLDAELRQARSRQRRAQEQIVEQLEQEIHQREARQAELVVELEKPETYQKPGLAPKVNRELLDTQGRLRQLNAQWEKEATRLAALEG